MPIKCLEAGNRPLLPLQILKSSSAAVSIAEVLISSGTPVGYKTGSLISQVAHLYSFHRFSQSSITTSYNIGFARAPTPARYTRSESTA